MLSGFIDDGYTAKGYVEAWPGLHPAVRFKYRPMIQEEVSAFEDECEFKKDAERARIAAAKIAEKLTEWSLGKPATAANVRLLTPRLYHRVMEIIWGTRASDIDPTWTDEEKADYGVIGMKREDTNEGN